MPEQSSEANGTKHWQVLFGAATVSIAVIGAMWVFISQIAGMSSDIAQLKERVGALQVQAFRNGEIIGSAVTSISVIRTQLREVETQFRGSDQIRNLMHAETLRVQSMLWEKTFPGTTFPTANAYYPVISDNAHNETTVVGEMQR